MNRGREIMRLVEEQVALGPRVPGTEANRALATRIETALHAVSNEVVDQEFPLRLLGRQISCHNVVGVFRARGLAREGVRPPLLIGAHYDTRIRADRDPDPKQREHPIPGANDGGSGTAILLHLLPILAAETLSRDVALAFFDAEDVGHIDGKEFAMGAARLAECPVEGFLPGEVIVLDMVGGSDMIFDIDAHILSHLPSRKLTTDLFRLGMSQAWEPFARDKPGRLKYIISDHTPFARRGIASCILIDIDYPQWHTQEDLPRAMSAASLGITEEALLLFLRRQPG